MFSYISKPKSINIYDFRNKRTSLCPKDYREIFISNNEGKQLSTLINNHFQGQEIGSEAYLKKSNFRFLKTVNITEQYTIDESTIEYCIPINTRHPKQGNILIVKDGAGNGLGEVCYYQLNNENENDSISAGVLAIDVKKEYHFYVLGILKSQHFKDFVNLNTPEGSIIKHSKKIALDYFVPYPTKKNYKEPNQIIEYVSLIVQNIINKEEEIKRKVSLINKLITTEIQENQTSICFVYKQPDLGEIIANQSRLDTGLYTRKYKSVIKEIKSYSNGYFQINSIPHKWISGSTPEVFIESQKGKYWWIAVADLSYGLYYKNIKRFNLKEDVTNLLEDGDILITRKGATVGKMNLYFNVNNIKTFVNEVLKVLRLNYTLNKKVFIGLFLNNYYGQTQLLNKGSKGTKQGLTNPNITDSIIPDFPEPKQLEIVKEYYNSLHQNNNLTLDNYLDKERERNNKSGIFQLNLEILSLKEKLALVVDKIIKEEPIKIEL